MKSQEDRRFVMGEAYVQRRNGRIEKVDPKHLPESVLDTLAMGCLSVYKRELYGCSPEHLLDEL